MSKETSKSDNKRKQTIGMGGKGEAREKEASIRTVGTPAPASAPAREVKITEDPKNYRRHNARNLSLIEKSLTDCGAGRSIVADSSGVVIGGNGTLRIVHTNGDELVVVVRDDIAPDDPRRKELALADNATSDSSDFDFEALALDFDPVDLSEWDVETPETGEHVVREGETDVDAVPDAAEEHPLSKRGEIYQLGDHRLMCADSTSRKDVLRLMGEDRADMVFTDPPYGVSIGDKNAELAKLEVKNGKCVSTSRQTTNILNDTLPPDELYTMLVAAMTNVRESAKEDASYYVSSPQGGELGLMMMMMKDSGLPVRHMLIWVKSSATFSMGRLDYDYQHEPIFYTWTKSHHCYRGGKFRTTILEFAKPRKCDLHPTMKPVELIENFIFDSTKEGDVVADFFGGSGSTLIACERTGRKCRMVELDEKYCDVIRRRWAEFKYGEGCDWQALTPAIANGDVL